MHTLAALAAKYWWLLGLTVVSFVGTLLLAPVIVCKLPADYFVREEPPIRQWTWKHILVQLLRNVIGAALVIVGVVLLFAPGQGVLTILIGIACLNFRGKRHVMRWFLFRPGVLKGLDWIRHRGGVPPFQHDPTPLRLSHTPSP